MFETSTICLETASLLPNILSENISRMNRKIFEEIKSGECVYHWLTDSTACGADIKILSELSDDQYARLNKDTGPFVSWFSPVFDMDKMSEALFMAKQTVNTEYSVYRSTHYRARPRDRYVLALIHEMMELGCGTMISSIFGIKPETAFWLQKKFTDLDLFLEACAIGFDSHYTLRLRHLEYLEQPLPQDPFTKFMCASEASLSVIYPKKFKTEWRTKDYFCHATRNFREAQYR